MKLTFPHQMGNAEAFANMIIPKYSDIKEQLHKCLRTYAPLLETEAIPVCYLYPYQDKCINSDTLVYKSTNVSPGFDASQIHSKGFVQDYVLLTLQDKRKGADCLKCIFNIDCIGVWKEYVELFENELDLFPIE
jgi:hypothetical protein